VFGGSGSINRYGSPWNSGLVDISHGAVDASALRLRRIDLLPARRNCHNTQDKSTQQPADSHGQRCCLKTKDAASVLKVSGDPISLHLF
jgi:hypothetical protein